MQRYHREVFYPDNSSQALKELTYNLNCISWKYSEHCLDNIKNRFKNMGVLLTFIKLLFLDYQNIFEYYQEDNAIIKVCYRVEYSEDIDIILVVSNVKKLITIYINQRDDKHLTLDVSAYNQE